MNKFETLKVFNYWDMPDVVKDAFLQCGVPQEGSYLRWYTPVDPQHKDDEPYFFDPVELVVLDWLLDMGADYNEKVLIYFGA